MKIIISFDDASYGDQFIADIILKYNLQDNTTFYFPVMPSVVNEPKGRRSLTQEELDRIASKFEIGSHTITHPLLTRIPLEQAAQEIVESRKILQKRYNQKIKKFAYPRGYANPEIQSIVQKAGYESARSTLVGYIDTPENKYFEQTTVHVGCDRKEYAGLSWIEYAKNMLKQAKQYESSTFSMFGHGWELCNYPNGLKEFDLLLNEAVS